MKRTVAKAFVLMMMALMGLATPLKSQGWLTLSAGLGYPELPHVGLRFKITNQFHIGAYVGSDNPGIDWSTFQGERPEDKEFSRGVAALYHFAGHSEYTELPPWYLRAGYSHLKLVTYQYTHKTNWADLRGGRAINFTEKFGVELDLGINILLNENAEIKPSGIAEGVTNVSAKKLRPAGGFRFFLRI